LELTSAHKNNQYETPHVSTSQNELVQAIAHHQAGRLAEAARGYEAVLEKNPNDPDALHFYGMLHFHFQRDIDAVRLIGRSLDLAPANPHAWINLGNILTFQGKPDKAREAWQRAIAVAPQMAEAWFNLGITSRDAGQFADAVNYLQTAIHHQPTFLRAHESLGQLFYRLGDFEQAAAAYRKWHELDPNNPLARHMVAATSGVDVPERADSEYVARLFDKYAKFFDANLQALGYRAPELLSSMLASVLDPAARLDILDAGCGTGLCGPLLRPVAQRLTGVDLSAKMIELARERGGYDDLVVEDLCTFMSSHPAHFDTLVAADTLEYFGNLTEVCTAAATALRPGGLFLFTVEALPDDAPDPYKLEVHGRFAHRTDYVRECLQATGFDVLRLSLETLRMERLQDVKGLVALARLAT
jgi:predicted TPR repeat methyltransferase